MYRVPEFVHMGREKKEEEKLALMGCFQGDHGNDLPFPYSFSSPCGVFSLISRRYMCPVRRVQQLSLKCMLCQSREALALRSGISLGWEQPLKLRERSGMQHVPARSASAAAGHSAPV